MNGQHWFYESNGQPAGPVTWNALMTGLRQGMLTHDTRVWAEHLTEWTPLGRAMGLSRISAPMPERPTSQAHMPATPTFEDQLPPKRKDPSVLKIQRWIFWIGGGSVAAVLLLCAGAFLRDYGVFERARAELGRESKAVHLVKTGHLYRHPEKRIGDAVNAFFGDPKWESGTGVDGETIGKTLVNASGQMMFRGVAVNGKIQFILEDDGTFKLHAFEMNGVPQNQIMIEGLIEKMYD